jgi:hypothetical protein
MRVLPQSPVLSLDPPILTAFARRDAFAVRHRLTREGGTLAPFAAGAWLGLRRANARRCRWIQAKRPFTTRRPRDPLGRAASSSWRLRLEG